MPRLADGLTFRHGHGCGVPRGPFLPVNYFTIELGERVEARFVLRHPMLPNPLPAAVRQAWTAGESRPRRMSHAR